VTGNFNSIHSQDNSKDKINASLFNKVLEENEKSFEASSDEFTENKN